MIHSTIQARAADNEAESRKRSKYAPLRDRSDFQPIAVETSGEFGDSTLVFLHIMGSRIASAKGANVADATYLVGCCERQCHLSCNVLSLCGFSPRVIIILWLSV